MIEKEQDIAPSDQYNMLSFGLFSRLSLKVSFAVTGGGEVAPQYLSIMVVLSFLTQSAA